MPGICGSAASIRARWARLTASGATRRSRTARAISRAGQLTSSAGTAAYSSIFDVSFIAAPLACGDRTQPRRSRHRVNALCPEEPVLQREQGRGGPGGHVQFGVYVLNMMTRRLLRNAELGGDLPGGPAAG